MNGAMPVPVETNTWVRSSSGSSMNLPLGPIIRIRWPTGRRQRSGREADDRDEPDVELVALACRPRGAATRPSRAAGAACRRRSTPIVMYWPGSNGVGSPSNRTQKWPGRWSCPSRRTSVALYCSASVGDDAECPLRDGSSGSATSIGLGSPGGPWPPWSAAQAPVSTGTVQPGYRGGPPAAADGHRGPSRRRRRAVQSRRTHRDPIAVARATASPPTPKEPPMAETVAPSTERAHRAAKRYIYAWGGGRAEGDATMRDLLGGKGAGLAEMTNAGLPVPPGFTITTEACNDYFAAGEQLPDGLWDGRPRGRPRGRAADRARASATRPTRSSSRSARGAKFSMPGMMDTVLNLGPQRADPRGPHRADRQRALRLGRLPALHPDVRPDRDGRRRRALRPGARGGQARPRRQARHRPDAADLRGALAGEFERIVREDTGRDFPTDPYEQLDLAIKAVFASWFGKRAARLPRATRRSPTTWARPSTS